MVIEWRYYSINSRGLTPSKNISKIHTSFRPIAQELSDRAEIGITKISPFDLKAVQNSDESDRPIARWTILAFFRAEVGRQYGCGALLISDSGQSGPRDIRQYHTGVSGIGCRRNSLVFFSLSYGRLNNVIGKRVAHISGPSTPKHIVNTINYNWMSQQCTYVGTFPYSLVLFISYQPRSYFISLPLDSYW